MWKFLCLGGLLVSVVHTSAHGDVCQTPLGDMGSCVSLKYCPQVLTLFENLPTDRAKQYSSVLRRLCGNRVTFDNYPVVCCSRVVTNPNTNTIITSTTTTTTTPRYNHETSTSRRRTDDDTSNPNDRANGKSAESCLGPFNENGICKPLLECNVYYDRAVSNPSDIEFKYFLESSNALCGGVGTNVCCPSNSTTNGQGTERRANTDNIPRRLPSPDEGCGFVRQQTTKVVGGQDSQIGDWPWIVLIGYDPWSATPFKCGGSLITARHVLTAAHCLRRDLSFVRLGEYDLSTETETPHVDVDVAKSVGHPNFGGVDRRNDIAILLLVRNVEFTDLICPICLPVAAKLRTKSYVDHSPFVAGWGRTSEGGNPSVVLKQLQLPILDNSVCQTTYQNSGRLRSAQQFDESVWCAGYLSGGQDTCQGDSGGPLMMPEIYKGITRYYLIGIVSYGVGCARIGQPSVYTNTQKFVDWIQEQIEVM